MLHFLSTQEKNEGTYIELLGTMLWELKKPAAKFSYLNCLRTLFGQNVIRTFDQNIAPLDLRYQCTWAHIDFLQII